jgi:predicted DNA-binding transcriptional regulator AlpA
MANTPDRRAAAAKSPEATGELLTTTAGRGHNGGPPLDPPATKTVLDREIERLLSVDDLATLLGVHRRTLLRWHGAGQGPPRCMLPGRRIAFRPESVVAWLQSRERTSERPPPRRPGRPGRRQSR